MYVLYTSITNTISAKECAAHNMALELYRADWWGKNNSMKRSTLCSATPIGVNAMVLQIGKRYTPFLAVH